MMISNEILSGERVRSIAMNTTVGLVCSEIGFYHHKCIGGVGWINFAIKVIGVKQILKFLVGGMDQNIFLLKVMPDDFGDLKILGGGKMKKFLLECIACGSEDIFLLSGAREKIGFGLTLKKTIKIIGIEFGIIFIDLEGSDDV